MARTGDSAANEDWFFSWPGLVFLGAFYGLIRLIYDVVHQMIYIGRLAMPQDALWMFGGSVFGVIVVGRIVSSRTKDIRIIGFAVFFTGLFLGPILGTLLESCVRLLYRYFL